MKYMLLLTVLLSSGAFASKFDDTLVLAEQGEAYAQYNLGIMYENGEGVPEDDAKAVKWYRKAADQGYANAQYNLALMYDSSEGVPENDAEAVKWYRKAAEAIKWYRQAADQLHAKAQYNLALMYDNGEGVPENDAEAVKWYRKAADQGSANAQANLGVLYYLGDGVPQNFIRSYVWMSMAKAQGNKSATDNLEILKPKMTKQQIAEGQALAARCYESNYFDCESGHKAPIVPAQSSESYACKEAKKSLKEWQQFMDDDVATRRLGRRQAIYSAGAKGGIGALAGAELRYDNAIKKRERENLTQKQQLRSRLIDLGC
jgi:TPR repeat protein